MPLVALCPPKGIYRDTTHHNEAMQDLLHMAQVTVELELWDTAGARAMGVKIASASTALDLAMFKPFAAQPATVELCGKDGKVSGSCLS